MRRKIRGDSRGQTIKCANHASRKEKDVKVLWREGNYAFLSCPLKMAACKHLDSSSVEDFLESFDTVLTDCDGKY